MANCNDQNNTCPPDPNILNNAILNYKRVRSSIDDPGLKDLLKIIDELKRLIECNVAIGTSGTSGVDGQSGESGTSGSSGETGVGVPPGGKQEQVLAKASNDDYDTKWISISQPAPRPTTSGTSGSDGTKGQDGTSGTSGETGESGTSGSSGTSGTSGTNGTSGTSGKEGTSGTSGKNGTSGTNGLSGNDGANSIRWEYFGIGITDFVGFFSVDNGTISDIKKIYLSNYDYYNNDVTSWLLNLSTLDLNNVYLQLIELGNPKVNGIFTVSSVTVYDDLHYVIEVNPVFVSPGYLNQEKLYSISWAGGGTGSGGTSGTSADSFVFPNDLVVSLQEGKTFGRYKNGDTIPATGKTVAEIIELAIQEPISPTVDLISPTLIKFNQTSISNKLTASFIINSLNADIDTALLEWRRNNDGSWTALSTDTITPLMYEHVLTDTNFNTSSFNYRYTVTDNVGAYSSASLNLSCSSYVTASSNLNVIGTSISLPETNRKRERGNVSTTLSGLISKNSNFVSMSSYTVQYRVNGGNWFGVPSLTNIPLSGNTVSIPSTIHVPTGSANITDVDYRVQVVDTYSTSSASQKTIEFLYMIYYGPSSSRPITSSMIRSLENRIFIDGPNPFNLFTGGVYSIFTVAMPNSFNLTEVLDLDAGYNNLTNNYSQSNFNVFDSGSNAVLYHTYTLSNSIAYTDYNHRHRISRTGLLWYTPTITTLNYTQ